MRLEFEAGTDRRPSIIRARADGTEQRMHRASGSEFDLYTATYLMTRH